MATKKIEVNQFVRRQTAESKFSHFSGSFEGLVSLVESNFESAQPSGRDGVLTVPLPPERFFSGVVEVSAKTQLRAVFAARRKGEAAYLQVEAVGAQKLPARYVEAIVYRYDVLGEEASTEAEWEIVSLNARPTEKPEPPTPVAMARNLLSLPGGSPASYTAEELAESIIYWSTRAMCG